MPETPSTTAPIRLYPRLVYCVRVPGSKSSGSSLNTASDSAMFAKWRVLWNSSSVQFRIPDWWDSRCRTVTGHCFAGNAGT